ncbi:single-stranded DNA-binding protein [Enterococcus cecorum]|uniref:single-stranded DNA-binding protein n=1 Tax=Enterococcus cecorum TaxID=44008 RepID=UPI000AA22EC7|nr:single-stranded DNA-binding protein [Enterococcus cecorum]MCJ0547758.1 single-stranded DNA-binding protein [Enterococcus cecorum]MCJ0553594.1 single-stranded DNA-binding protein [Enterococcus cecorum]MCJ0558154.1 single-stranded DNA-binding protein [Enterococcus cecorum]MCJ0562885.1 single-stranded DNA-binding protein [Enterococcus cecorum]MDZ5559679.1 single-stranded DNA-binding protein [Enterococcus cecorum]
MMNHVQLIGRLTKDPELRYTSQGVGVATFTLAVQRNYSDNNGERQTDFIQCISWRKLAETIANHLVKGSLIACEGRIQTRNYENQQGQRVYVTEVVVNEVQFLETKEQMQYRKATKQQSFLDNQNFEETVPSYMTDENYTMDDLPF